MAEAINHPQHYNTGKIEVIAAIEAWGFGEGFNKGNAIKYIARAGHKNKETEIEDLKKAQWYIQREIERLENANSTISGNTPRLLTLEEAGEAEVCWIEKHNERVIAPCKVRIYAEDDYSAFINRLLPYVNENIPKHEYGKRWRCWSSRPSDQQIMEAEWNG